VTRQSHSSSGSSHGKSRVTLQVGTGKVNTCHLASPSDSTSRKARLKMRISRSKVP
jgi:hypothetical protein